MKDQVKAKRFEKLKSMRDALCEREQLRLEKVKYQKWLLDQVRELKEISECQDCTVEIIKDKIDQILCEIIDAGVKK